MDGPADVLGMYLLYIQRLPPSIVKRLALPVSYSHLSLSDSRKHLQRQSPGSVGTNVFGIVVERSGQFGYLRGLIQTSLVRDAIPLTP